MGYRFRDRTLTKVGVVGSGQIGPDIALHFVKVLAPHGATVVVVDISADALKAGEAKLTKKIDKGVETKAFKPAEAEAMKAAITFTSDYDALAGADLVVEAATEDVGIKRKIFATLEQSCPETTLMLSNSSHLEPEVIFAEAQHKGRTGDALVFANTDGEGAPYSETLHAGAPVASGEKWLLSLWCREKRFWFWD